LDTHESTDTYKESQNDKFYIKDAESHSYGASKKEYVKEQSRKKDLTMKDESKKHYTFDKSKIEGLGALKPTDKVADP